MKVTKAQLKEIINEELNELFGLGKKKKAPPAQAAPQPTAQQANPRQQPANFSRGQLISLIASWVRELQTLEAIVEDQPEETLRPLALRTIEKLTNDLYKVKRKAEGEK
jgi:hypothetical protein